VSPYQALFAPAPQKGIQAQDKKQAESKFWYKEMYC